MISALVDGLRFVCELGLGGMSFSISGLEPKKLKEMVRKDLSRNLAQYSTGPIAVKSMMEIRAI